MGFDEQDCLLVDGKPSIQKRAGSAAEENRRDGSRRHESCSITAALEKSGLGTKDYVAVSVPSAQLVQALESKFVDAASLNPPFMFLPNAAVLPSSWTSAL